MSIDHSFNLWVKDTLIAPTETRSGVKFGQAQAALARQWVYDSVDRRDMPTEVTITIPEPTSDGLFLTEKTTMKTEKYRIPASYDEAANMIAQFERNASTIGGARFAAVADTVGQHALQDTTRLADEQWFGTKEEELDAYVISLILRRPAPKFHALSRYVSELAYIHSKVMIVDDRRVIVSMSPIIPCSNSLTLS
jgi:phospholipase D1/2